MKNILGSFLRTPNVPKAKLSIPKLTVPRPATSVASPIVKYLEDDAPVASKPQDIKGIYSFAIQYLYFKNLGSPPKLSNNRFFELYYFPEDHFLNLFTKSKPAIRFQFAKGSILNNPDADATTINTVYKSQKSLRPLDYAVYRNKTRRIIRDAFFESYSRLNGANGLYQITCKLVPRDEELGELREAMNKCIGNAKHKDLRKFVEKSNAKLSKSGLVRYLKSLNVPIPDELLATANVVNKKNHQKKTGSKS